MKDLLVHFDVSSHFVEADTFVASVTAVQKTVSAISNTYFDGQLPVELVVLPPEMGSLKQLLGVTVGPITTASVILWAMVQVMDSPTVQDISRALIGQTPSELIIEKIEDAKKLLQNLRDNEEVDEARAVEVLEELIALSARRALEIERVELTASRLPTQLKFDLELAQSTFYRAAYNNQSVRGIGFSHKEDFPIQRSDFVRRAIRPRKPEEMEAEPEWTTFEDIVKVSSPNFDRSDQNKRRWKGKSASGQVVLFEITDDQFWEDFHAKKFKFGEVTELRVQVAVCRQRDIEKARFVIRVVSIDGKVIAARLGTKEVEDVLDGFVMNDAVKDGQPKLL